MSSQRKIAYEKLSVELFTKDSKNGPITVEKAKELLGWESEAESKDEFKSDFKFRDKEGNKIRLNNNPTNRPFRMSLALSYANEMLRGKWSLNGETIVIDKRGCLQSAQHRLTAIVLAEQIRKQNPEHWKQYISGSVKIEGIVVFGIDDEDSTVDTIDLGKTRTLGDVLFRNREFEKCTEREQRVLSNILSGATRLAWLRLGGNTVSDALKFPHSEALEFIENHPKLLDCVNHIQVENGPESLIRRFISLGYASGLMYLMATCKTDPVKFDEKGSEAIDYSMMDKAEEFWTTFAQATGLTKGSPILALRTLLNKSDASGGAERDEIISAVVNAWNAWIDGKEVTSKDLKPSKTKVDGKMVISELPRMGGLDTHRERAVEPEAEEVAPAPKAKGKGKSKKAPVAPAKKAPKHNFKVGDEVNVDYHSDQYEAYTGKVTEISEDGLTVDVEFDGQVYTNDMTTKGLTITKA